MQGHVGHISNYPAIVRSGGDVENHARLQIKARSILVLDGAMPGEDSAGMRGMAERCASRWRIVDGPLPAGLIGGSTKLDASRVHDFESAERKFADLVRLFERLQNRVRHPPSI